MVSNHISDTGVVIQRDIAWPVFVWHAFLCNASCLISCLLTCFEGRKVEGCNDTDISKVAEIFICTVVPPLLPLFLVLIPSSWEISVVQDTKDSAPPGIRHDMSRLVKPMTQVLTVPCLFQLASTHKSLLSARSIAIWHRKHLHASSTSVRDGYIIL